MNGVSRTIGISEIVYFNVFKDEISICRIKPVLLKFIYQTFLRPEFKTLEWYILNPDQLINLEINNIRGTSIIWSWG